MFILAIWLSIEGLIKFYKSNEQSEMSPPVPKSIDSLIFRYGSTGGSSDVLLKESYGELAYTNANSKAHRVHRIEALHYYITVKLFNLNFTYYGIQDQDIKNSNGVKMDLLLSEISTKGEKKRGEIAKQYKIPP